ncbi:MAG: DUF3126 family protein [Rhodospirillaceae bacterium]
MTPLEIARIQSYLRKAFSNNLIRVIPPPKISAPIEVHVGDEFIGVLHRDEDEGEVSYSLLVSILEEDLPPSDIN